MTALPPAVQTILDLFTTDLKEQPYTTGDTDERPTPQPDKG